MKIIVGIVVHEEKNETSLFKEHRAMLSDFKCRDSWASLCSTGQMDVWAGTW